MKMHEITELRREYERNFKQLNLQVPDIKFYGQVVELLEEMSKQITEMQTEINQIKTREYRRKLDRLPYSGQSDNPRRKCLRKSMACPKRDLHLILEEEHFTEKDVDEGFKEAMEEQGAWFREYLENGRIES